jgi:phospholipase/carboxylesterase
MYLPCIKLTTEKFSDMSNLEIEPKNKNAKNLVVLLHGLGSDGQDLLGLVPFFRDALPDCHFFSPNGIERCDMSPFGYQWFSLSNRDLHFMQSELERSTPMVLDIIESKLNELKLTFEDLILIGFSQGTMMSLYIAHAFEFKVKAVVGFSGAFFPPAEIKNNKSPICLIHGEEDDVVSFSSMASSKDRLEKSGVKEIETLGIKNLTHTIDLSGIEFAKNFIIKHLRG